MPYGAFPVPREQLEARLVRRAWSDPEFKALLLADPRRAVAAELGVEMPESVEIEVVEERPGRMVIVIPVDVSGFKPPSVDAMIGRAPPPRSPRTSNPG